MRGAGAGAVSPGRRAAVRGPEARG